MSGTTQALNGRSALGPGCTTRRDSATGMTPVGHRSATTGRRQVDGVVTVGQALDGGRLLDGVRVVPKPPSDMKASARPTIATATIARRCMASWETSGICRVPQQAAASDAHACSGQERLDGDRVGLHHQVCAPDPSRDGPWPSTAGRHMDTSVAGCLAGVRGSPMTIRDAE